MKESATPQIVSRDAWERARADLTLYLSRADDAGDRAMVRERLHTLGRS